MAAIEAPARRSATTLARRGPTRSTSPPERSALSASGTVAKKAAIPVLAGLPVVVRTNHGIASAATTDPASDSASDATSATRGTRFRSMPVFLPPAPTATLAQRSCVGPRQVVEPPRHQVRPGEVQMRRRTGLLAAVLFSIALVVASPL